MLRGGSFNNNDRNVRCAYRNNNDPNNRNDNIGFRLCVSHTFPCLPEMRFGYDWIAEAIREMARVMPWLFVRRAKYTKRLAAWMQVPQQAA
ncbi:MAG: hypothetical protein ACOYYJ_19605 [Chloroflexota bacterium]